MRARRAKVTPFVEVERVLARLAFSCGPIAGCSRSYSCREEKCTAAIWLEGYSCSWEWTKLLMVRWTCWSLSLGSQQELTVVPLATVDLVVLEVVVESCPFWWGISMPSSQFLQCVHPFFLSFGMRSWLSRLARGIRAPHWPTSTTKQVFPLNFLRRVKKVLKFINKILFHVGTKPLTNFLNLSLSLINE